MGEPDVAGRTLRMANAACLYPFYFRAAVGEVVEMQAETDT